MEAHLNSIYRSQAQKNNGVIPPESFLIPGMPGGIIFAASLLLLSGFSSTNFTPALPLLFSVPMGLGIALIFIAVFTYTVTAYRPVAASAMAANSALRSAFAAGFPLFAGAMYNKLGSVKAGCLLGGIMTGAAILPYVALRFVNYFPGIIDVVIGFSSLFMVQKYGKGRGSLCNHDPWEV